MDITFLSIEEFDSIYKPTLHPNKIDDGSDLYETYGEDLEAVNKADPNKVWTLLDDEGSLILVNGFAFCDRLNYVITEVPWSGEPRSINVDYEYQC